MNALTKTESAAPLALFDPAQFAGALQVADALAKSTLIPEAYRGKPENVLVALELASRVNASPLMVMQNLAVIEGRPSWSAVFVIAAINACGRFSPLAFEYQDGDEIDVEYIAGWDRNPNTGKSVPRKAMMKLKNRSCIAWATERATGERRESPIVSMEMAVKEGWYSRTGSKWQSMPDVMLSYRAASFFGKRYAPDLLMGMPTQDEAVDIRVMDAIEVKAPAETTGPDRPAPAKSRTDDAKSRLLARQRHEKISESLVKAGAMPPDPLPEVDLETGEILDAPPQPEPDPLADLLLALNGCQSKDALEAHRPAVAALKGDDKRRAVDAWKAVEARFAESA